MNIIELNVNPPSVSNLIEMSLLNESTL